MTAGELDKLRGMNATLRVSERSGATLGFPVKITDARESFGRLDVLVTPLDGEGEAWVSAERVKVRGK